MSLSDSDCLELPSFEAFDAEDRPPPPSIGDYPIGCEVDLVDIGPARVAQTDELWEPFMDALFGRAQRSVRVVRHKGDYTFVVCENDPELIIGCTLYRACLSEPKVRFRKYIPSRTVEDIHGQDASDDGLFELYASSSNQGDESADVDGNINKNHHHHSNRLDDSARGTDPLGLNVRTTTTPWQQQQQQQRVSGIDANKRQRVTGAGGTPQRGGAAGVQSPADLMRYKYNYATRKGYDALCKENYKDAVRYYTKAVKYSTDGGVRCLSNRSVAFLGLRNVEAAFKDATRVIELAPQNFVGYVRAGNTLRSMKRYEEAKNYYESAISIEPTNETLKYLLLSNSIMMLYASKVEHRRVASISLDRKTLNIVLLAKKDMKRGELAWTESSTSVVLLGRRPPPHSNNNSSSSACGPQYNLCFQCFLPLTKIREFCESIPELQPSVLKKIYSDHNTVDCNGQCGAVYCSESCRSKAWAAHHWVECETQGKWSEAYKQLPKLLHDFSLYYKDIVANDNNETNTNTNNESKENHSIPSQVDVSVDAIIACLHITCRMFSNILSNGQMLEDAVHMFDWMLPKECSLHNASPDYQTTNSIQSVIINKLLKPVYTLFEQLLTKDESRYLSFDVFLHCYERARYNAMKIRVSVWPVIQAKAGNHIELLKIKSTENSVNSMHSSLTRDVSTNEDYTTHLNQLKCIVRTPAESIAGYFECLAVFKVFAATFATSCDPQWKGGVSYNVRKRAVIEPGAIIHIDVTENIRRNQQLVSDRALSDVIA